jgi:DNA-binding FadR family transcriptional regulator
MERLIEHLRVRGGLLEADPLQLIDNRVIAETGVLPNVARWMKEDSAIETRLRDLVEKFRSARDLKTWIELDIQFHHSLLDASGLQPLVAFGDLLHNFFHRFRESINRSGWKADIESRQPIVNESANGRVLTALAELR